MGQDKVLNFYTEFWWFIDMCVVGLLLLVAMLFNTDFKYLFYISIDILFLFLLVKCAVVQLVAKRHEQSVKESITKLNQALQNSSVSHVVAIQGVDGLGSFHVVCSSADGVVYKLGSEDN